MVTLENLTPRARVFSLGLAVAPIRATHTRRVVDKHGKTSTHEKRVVHDDSITLLAKGKLEVPEHFLRARSIQKAIAKREVRVLASAPTAPAKTKPADDVGPAPAQESDEPKSAGPRPRSTRG